MLKRIENNTDISVYVELLKEEKGILYYRFKAINGNLKDAQKITAVFELSAKGAFSVWNSNCGFLRGLEPDWKLSTASSRVTSGTPVQQIIGMDNNNVACVAVLDAKNPINIRTGIIEETAKIICKVEFFTIPIVPFEKYETIIRIDLRKKRYYECIREVQCWWEKKGGYHAAKVPELAEKPVYSTWYSFHQMLDEDYLVEQCRLSAELGMESVIIDDGWQTDNNSRGYAYCGDWVVAPDKIADMRRLVDKIHKAGLKVMIWFSVPFVGIYSEANKRFEGKILDFEGNDFGCLDPRYKDVREYLTGTYKRAVTEWDLDGLKLDFIDAFRLSTVKGTTIDKQDIESLEEAVEQLLLDIKEELTSIKPDICIEFRQTYIGPAVKECGNMLRVRDCPADPIKNRMGCVDIRMLAGKTPVHSDMLMWDTTDTPENAALQFINALFCVPQISVLIDKLPEEHYDMLKFYLNFWSENSDLLLHGDFCAKNPEANYSIISAENDTEIIAAAFSDRVIRLEKQYERIMIVNGTGGERLIVDSIEDIVGYKYIVKNCMGVVVYKGTVIENTFGIDMPLSGMIEIYR